MDSRDIIVLKSDLYAKIRDIQRQMDYITEWILLLEQKTDMMKADTPAKYLDIVPSDQDPSETS